MTHKIQTIDRGMSEISYDAELQKNVVDLTAQGPKGVFSDHLFKIDDQEYYVLLRGEFGERTRIVKLVDQIYVLLHEFSFVYIIDFSSSTYYLLGQFWGEKLVVFQNKIYLYGDGEVIQISGAAINIYDYGPQNFVENVTVKDDDILLCFDNPYQENKLVSALPIVKSITLDLDVKD